MANAITSSRITVGSLGAYLARPVDDDRGAGMLLLPMITGIGADVRAYADDIARAGMTALAWDPFHGPSLDDTPREELARLLGGLDDSAALAEQALLLDHLHSELGLRRVGVIGWCLGGRFALLLAGSDSRPVNVVSFHPTVPIPPAPNHTLDAFEHAARITAPVMVLYPGDDDLVDRAAFGKLQDSLQGRETGPSLIHVYPKAGHGFSSTPKRAANPVNAAAYELSWPQVLAFIQTTTRG